ncbi:hypothetical protein ASE67_01475 [Sphingomonas sp. Leaf23]|uniref:phage tail assembly protein n=1 Tax=Sphingomonas sp. Leaf23 TaxID=1735689 RepID=UPI0006F3AE40|nr:phage tail assembly protein [Sphingomonas sp. Leaf23]KQM88457.1 hypothetical protein ASE67_01475 [Sphingomonas sp. Leaf23]
MTDTKIRGLTLENDIVVGTDTVHKAGDKITVRKPGAGELRGLQVNALIQGDYNALETLAPRITSPILHKAHVFAMDPADFTAFAGEVLDFLLPTAAKQPVYQDA